MRQPLNLMIVLGPTDDDYIQTSLCIDQVPVLLQVTFTAIQYAPALGIINRFDGGTEIISAPVTYFNQYQNIRIPHDQIYFAEGRAIVSIDEFQPVLLQEDQCSMLGPAPALVGTAASFSILRPDHDQVDGELRQRSGPTATAAGCGRIRSPTAGR